MIDRRVDHDRIISIIAECSSSDDRTLVNNAYLCLNHCLEQLIRFCDEALFFDDDEERAIRRIYKKFSYPIVPPVIDTASLLNLLQDDKNKSRDEEREISLNTDSSTLEKVRFYMYHLKSLLKSSDQQHISTASDFDDALLQFSSFISNGTSEFPPHLYRTIHCRIRFENLFLLGLIHNDRQQSRWDLCHDDLVSLVLQSTSTARIARLQHPIQSIESNSIIQSDRLRLYRFSSRVHSSRIS